MRDLRLRESIRWWSSSRFSAAPPATAHGVPLLAFSPAFATDFGLLATFGGMGLLVNGIVVYIYFQIRGEHQQNDTPPAPRA